MATVMIIEPDVLIRASISESLRACGYRVIEGVSAPDLWTVLDSNTPVDIVMVDARLPGTVNGFQLAHTLRQTPGGIDVILTAGFADAAEKSIQLCERGPLKATYRRQDVLRQIQLLLERRRAIPNAPDP
ncbi:MAG TPA: response regulator [Steroidobacteraceae bacterium]|jgi:CheY-like chemotaxis protein|nr:response regulator [Steroidobacteraceae bacterium]